MPVTGTTFTRIWQFVDQYIAGDRVFRSSLDVALDDLASGINTALGLDYLPTAWDASLGVFPTIEVADILFFASTSGTISGVSFDVGDLLVPAVGSPSTSVYKDNWLKIPAKPRFDTFADLLAYPSPMVGAYYTVEVGYNREPEVFKVVAANTYTANGDTVRSLSGVLGQAVSMRSRFNTVSEMLADTREAGLFADDPSAEVDQKFETQDFKYEMALSGATDHFFATAGLVKLTPTPYRAIDVREFNSVDSFDDQYADEYSAGFKQASDYLQGVGGGTIWVPEIIGAGPLVEGGYVPIAERLDIHSTDAARLTIRGAGRRSHIRNLNTTGSFGGERSVLTLGNYNGSGSYPQNLLGGARYDLSETEAGSPQQTLATIGDAANLTAGTMVRIFSKLGNNGSDPDLNGKAFYQQLNFLESIDGATLNFRYPVDLNRTDMVVARCDGSDTGVTDWNGDVSRGVVGITLRDLGFSTADFSDADVFALGACLEGRFDNIHVYRSEAVLACNGMAFCNFTNFTGNVAQKAFNPAQFWHNTLVSNFNINCGSFDAPDANTPNNLIQFEEGARDVHLSNFHVVYGGYNGVPYVIRPAKGLVNCGIDGFSVTATNANIDHLVFGSFASTDQDLPREGFYLRNGHFNCPRTTGIPIFFDVGAASETVPFYATIQNITVNNGLAADIITGSADPADDSDLRLIRLEGTGIDIDNVSFTRGNLVEVTTDGGIGNKITRIKSAEDITLTKSGTGPLIAREWYGKTSAPFLSGATSGSLWNQIETTANTVLDTAAFPAADGANAFLVDDQVRIHFSGTVTGTTDAKTVQVLITGSLAKTYTINFASGDIGTFEFDINMAMSNNGVSMPITGKAWKNDTPTEVGLAPANAVTVGTTDDLVIQFQGWVDDAADSLDFNWHVEPRRRRLNV